MIKQNIFFNKYLTYNEKDIKWQIFCRDVGFTKIPTGVNYPPFPQTHPPQYRQTRGRVLDEFQIVYITRGGGFFKDLYNEYKIYPGVIIVLFPSTWHWYCPDEKVGWDEYWIGFNGQYPELLIKNDFLSPQRPIFDIGLNDSILQLYIDSIDLVKNESPYCQMLLGANIIHLIAKLLSISQQKKEGTEDDKIIQKAKFMMNENIYNIIDMDSFVYKLGIGYSHLKKIFKNNTGMSPYQYFLELKINKAKELLQASQFSVKEISYQLAFNNQYYFSKLFKNKTGISPSKWIIRYKI